MCRFFYASVSLSSYNPYINYFRPTCITVYLEDNLTNNYFSLEKYPTPLPIIF